jgi:hypothetical protein
MIKKLLFIVSTLYVGASIAQTGESINVNPTIGLGPLKTYGHIPTASGSNLRLNNTNWTIEAWVFIPSNATAEEMFVVESYSGGNTGGFVLRISSTRRVKAYQIAGPSMSNSVTGSTQLSVNTWSHIAATMDQNTGKLRVFLNGIEDGITDCFIQTNNVNDYLLIGARGDDTRVWQTHSIDEVRIWNVAKTASELTAAKDDCLIGNETGLLAYYNFEGQMNSTITDITANNNDGSIPNYDTWAVNDGVFECATNELSEASIISLELAPNPASDNINIITDAIDIHATIFDLQGNLIKTTSSKQISISELKSGIYLMNIQVDNELIQKRFIKQ